MPEPHSRQTRRGSASPQSAHTSSCICFYDIALWKIYHASTMKKLVAAYVKCLKHFFGFNKYSTVTAMLLQLGQLSFNTLLCNRIFMFNNRLILCRNDLVMSFNIV